MTVPLDSTENTIPPVLPNEIELVLRNFKEEVILAISKALDRGESPNKIKEAFGTTVYSEWKEIPNFLFRIMFFPVCPHAESGPTLNNFKVSAYVESARKEDWPENWMCYGTRFCIIIINPKEPHSSIFKRDTFNFSKAETDRGWQGIMSLSQIMENGFLNHKGDLTIRAGVYPVGAEIDRSARDPNYNCREMTGFVGLQNHGATCYMNALLQSLYSITKFRKAVYKLTFELSEVMGAKSYQIIQNLTNSSSSFNYYEVDNAMDVDTPYPETTTNTFRNAGEKHMSDTSFDENDMENDEKLDELLDKLEESDYCNLLLEEEEEKKRMPCVGLALQNLFYLLRYSQDSPACKELMKSFGWDSSDMFTQQDSHELLKLLLDKMEEQMKGTSVEGSVKNIFEGEMETYIECIDIEYKSCRKETFEDIQLDVQGCNNIYESLDMLTEPELLAGDNMYEAKGHGKQRANKGIRFLKFPPVVIFLLKRFTFDLAKMDTVKLNTRFEFYEEINLSRYIQSATDTSINDGKKGTDHHTTGKKGGSKEDQEYEYVLQAVSVHHGSINSGHYYAFAKNEDNWYRFDDEIVTKVSEYAVINDNFGGEDQECYNYLTTNTNNPSIYNNHINRYKRNKVYNAYILMYVLKSKKNEILGEVDMMRENYQMMRRCKIQNLLSNIRLKIRERLNRYIKLKIYTPSDFQGNTLLNQHFNTWPNKFVITQDKNTNLNELLKYVHSQLQRNEEESGKASGAKNGKGDKNGVDIKNAKLNDENVDQYYYVLGFNKQFNKFMCLNDVKNKHKIGLETLHDLAHLIRKEYYQQYDPTVYLLYVTPSKNQSQFEEGTRDKKEEGKGLSTRMKLTPKSGLEVFSPSSSASGSLFTPTSGVFTATLLNPQTHTANIMVFIKYYDIFSKDSQTNLKCLNLSFINPARNASQLLPMVIQPLLGLMSNNVVTQYRIKDLKVLLKSLNNLYQTNAQSNGASNISSNPSTRRVITVKESESQEDSEESSDDKQIVLDEDEEEEHLVLDIDNKIDLLMKKESLHLYWYIELDNTFTNLHPNKKLEDQLTNGDILVCNFRPTDEMRREIELVENKTNLKEDFERTTPSVATDGFNNFVLCSSKKYLDTFSLDIDDSLKQYRDLRMKWRLQCEQKVELHKLYTLSIYDYPSYIQWKLNNIKVVFKLYDPLEALSIWKNCSNGLVNPNQGEVTDRDGTRSTESMQSDAHQAFSTSGSAGGNQAAFDPTVGHHPQGSNAPANIQQCDTTLSGVNTARSEKQIEEGFIDKLEMVVDLRTPCKHVLRYVCWALGVDPCHVLIFNNVPHNFESVGSHLLSLDDFCYKDNALGYSQQSLMQLFNIHGKLLNNNMSMYSSYNYMDSRYSTGSPMDDEDMDSDGSGRQLTRYNLRKLSARTSNSTSSDDAEENVVYMGLLFEPYYLWNFKTNEESLNVVAQVFNEKVQVVASLMCKVPHNSTVGQLCNLVSQNYYDFLNSPYSSQKRTSSHNLFTYQKRSGPTRSHLASEEEDEWPSLVLVDVLTSMYSLVDLNSKIMELPQYSNTSVRNLFSAPLRFVPNWSPEQHELIAQKKLFALTVHHQTADREMFGHPFQVLVTPTWNFLQIKTHIRNTLDLPKREWDRWTFYQVTDPHVRTWKANDDLLDWDKPGLRILAEHPRPTDKPRHTGAMKIT